MNAGKGKLRLRAETWAVPGQDQSLDELILLLQSRGEVILSVDRENNRLLLRQEEAYG